VWCFIPIEKNGSVTLYYRFIRPFILRHQDKIDKAMDEAKDALHEAKGMAQDAASEEALRRLADEAKLD